MNHNRNNKIIPIEHCKTCNNVLKNDWKYCPVCNTEIEMITCHHCHNKIKENWSYCPYCCIELRSSAPQKVQKKTNDRGNEWLTNILNN